MRYFAKLKNKILILSIFIFCFAIATFAFFTQTGKANALGDTEQEYTPKVTVESKTVHRGQTFYINIDLSENQGLTALYLTLNYDSSVMKLAGLELGEALDDLTLTTDNVDTEIGYAKVPFNMSWANEMQDASNGTIVRLIFESFSEAEIGDYEITLTYDENNTRQDYEQPIQIDIANGIVHLTEGAYKVFYCNYNGSILFSKDYNEGEAPSYVGETPERPEDAEYEYEFIGWKGIVSEQENVIIYGANYKKTAKQYGLYYYVDGINGEPDGIIDAGDYHRHDVFAFGENIDLLVLGDKGYYEFFGWYIDEGFTEPFLYGTMPSHDLRLFGYYKFALREDNIPKIKLSATSDNGEALVKVEMIKNTGFNSMVLTLVYDRDALVLSSFDEKQEIFKGLRFSTTNKEAIEQEDFKFYFSSDTENNEEVGLFLTLTFRIKDNVEDGNYFVGFTYDEHTDATYYIGNGEARYTKLEIINTEVPVGMINHWKDTVGRVNEIEIDVLSKKYKPINVKLYVEMITNQVFLDEGFVSNKVGEKYDLSSAYTVKLLQNGEEIEPDTTLRIKITLNSREKKCKNLKLYRVDKDGVLLEYDFKREGDQMVFYTDELCDWYIFANGSSGIQDYALFIILPTLLAIASISYALIVMGIKRKS